jgi:serine/threonine protein phosphatase PrpC
MEDAHVGVVDLGDGNSFFGVFDGHGGPEVSDWVASNIVETLKANENYKKGDYKQALKETFLALDEAMQTPE